MLDELVAASRKEMADGRALVRRVASAYGQGTDAATWRSQELPVFLSVVYAAVRHLRPRRVVQTGTWVGGSTVAMAMALRETGSGRLFTIDPEPMAYFGVLFPVARARRAVASAGLDDQVEFVRGYSTTPGDSGRMDLPPRPRWRLIRLRSLGDWDMMVVDGDHTFEGCYRDLVYGAAGLAGDGPRLMVVHDYMGIEEVRRAVRCWRARTAGTEMKVVPSECGTALVLC